jgi:hypothetical protein
MHGKSTQKDKKSQTAFQRTHRMVEHLILRLKDYKTEMDYKNIDFMLM